MWKAGTAALVFIAACTTTTVDTTSTTTTVATTTTSQPLPVGPLEETTRSGLDELLDDAFTDDFDITHLTRVVEGGDQRAAWVISDLLRFYQTGPPRDELVWAFTQLTGEEFVPGEVDFVWTTNALMRRDLPAFEGYAELKKDLFADLDPRWARLFGPPDSIDWRSVTWGGVLIDDRELGDATPCNCIPALDDPVTTDAAGGDWYGDSRIVFGIELNGESIALPKHQMEVHEMVNLTLGGEDLGIPYCTLCGSAQAYLTGDVAEQRVVLRTSGLLSRSNKVMYDVNTGSIFDTFTGKAVTGPLAERGLVLDQVTVVASTWGDWKRAHPETRIIARDGGIGRVYRDNPLGDRDADGPIFPVGDVDPRLPIQLNVVGVISPDGTPIAFPTMATKDVLAEGSVIEFQGVTVRLTDGIRVFDQEGTELPTHQAFWFAWSQFYPDTLVWEDG